MVLSSCPVLERLGSLDTSATDFHHQLDNILYGEEYARCVENLQGDDLMRLVDFLDNVRGRVICSSSCSCLPRFLTVLLLPVPLSRSVCKNSEACAKPGWFSPPHMHHRLA